MCVLRDVGSGVSFLRAIDVGSGWMWTSWREAEGRRRHNTDRYLLPRR